MKKQILIVVFSEMRFQPRARRQVEALKDAYDVSICCTDNEGYEEYPYIAIPNSRTSLSKRLASILFALIRNFEKAYWTRQIYKDALSVLNQSNKQFDLIIAHDYYTLPVVLEFSKKSKAKILYDAHEYAPLQYENELKFRFFVKRVVEYICRTYIPRVDSMVTVGSTIAKRYKQDTGISSEIILNAPKYVNLSISKLSNLRKIRLVHHGLAYNTRGIDNIIEMLKTLDSKFEVHLYLVGSQEAIEKIKRYSKEDHRLVIHDPVAVEDISREINQYDIGIIPWKPVTFNLEHAFPNKFFEYIQARLGIALLGPYSDMSKVVNEYQNGIIGSQDYSPEYLARQLNLLTVSEINKFKLASDDAAHKLNADVDAQKLRKIVGELLL